jgi:hypothetical protein
MDEKVKAAWMGHFRHIVIDNSTDFDGKIKRVLDVIAAIVGIKTIVKDAVFEHKCDDGVA